MQIFGWLAVSSLLISSIGSCWLRSVLFAVSCNICSFINFLQDWTRLSSSVRTSSSRCPRSYSLWQTVWNCIYSSIYSFIADIFFNKNVMIPLLLKDENVKDNVFFLQTLHSPLFQFSDDLWCHNLGQQNMHLVLVINFYWFEHWECQEHNRCIKVFRITCICFVNKYNLLSFDFKHQMIYDAIVQMIKD